MDSTFVVTSLDSDRNPSRIANTDISFEKDWINKTVESEIWLGNKLREKKPVSKSKYYEQSVANIDFLGSFAKQCEETLRKNKYSKNKKNATSPNSKSPQRRRPKAAGTSYTAYSVAHKYCIPSSPRGRPKTSKYKNCPMRIAELAMPTKRQCIDTWRNKSDLLPGFMVERLKQHVLDQRPIVKIPEAIICFQRRNQSTSKTRCKSAEKKQGRYVNISKPCRHMDSRTLCIVFAHRISKRLSTQMNLTLNADLERLSKIIYGDIAKLLKFTFSKKTEYKAIHKDVSNKITIWITSILEDLSLKLLEEDLRDSKISLGDAHLSKQFVTPVETLLKEFKRKGAELNYSFKLEEEEGPALDFIDDLFDKVIGICEPQPVLAESASGESVSEKSRESGESQESNETEKSEESETAKLEELAGQSNQSLTPVDSNLRMEKLEETPNTVEADNLSDEQYFRKEIQNVMNSIQFDPEDYFKNEISNIIDNIDKESENYKSNGPEDIADKYIGVIATQLGIKNNINKADTITDSIINLKGTNKMAELPLKTEYVEKYKDEEETFDKLNIDENADEHIDGQNNDKRVAMYTGRNVDELIEAPNVDDENVDQHADHVDELGQNYSNVNERSEILLEESDDEMDSENVKLSHQDLGDADESWPDNLDAKLKVSDMYVHKLTTSLKDIMEMDESQKSPRKSVTPEKPEIPISKQEVEIFDYKFKDLANTEEYETDLQSFESAKENREITTVEPIQIYTKTLDRKSDKSVPVVEESDSKLTRDSENIRLDYTESEIISTESSFSGKGYKRVNRTSNRKPSYQKSSSLSDCGWRVKLSTAPSWVRSFGHGEPSDECLYKEIMPTRVTEADIRKWCNDLEKAYVNLEMWGQWIHCSCKETICLLKQKKTTCPGLVKRHTIHWLKLRRNIQKDCILWMKLYKRTKRNFNDLKSKYNNVEIVTAEYRAVCTCDRNSRMDIDLIKVIFPHHRISTASKYPLAIER
ncbi:hypothetical protein HW555_002602 [Spodoptera exigua]|uniref:Uncharacterized protein n=1 Tax=Spodoptera exigua TaxID=7107 RepID=A0A835L6V8_SPOEX|nr:hypothetical protein HW555_002602 [Spodoptera exigua]